MLRVCVLAIVFAMVVCSAPSRAFGQSMTTVRIGVTQSDCCVEAEYAQDLGYFNQAGISAQIIPFTSVSALSTAVAGGAIDIAIATPVQVAEAISRGIPFRVIAAGGVVTVKTPSSALCVATSSPYRSPADLKGQTIAVIGLKTTAEFGLRTWLGTQHIDQSDIKVIEMPFSEMPQALSRGAVAAAQISEPTLSVAQSKGLVRAISVPSDSIAPAYMVSVWFARDDFAAAHPDAVSGFVRTIYRAARWANTHQLQSAEILAKYTGQDPAIVKSMIRVPYSESLNIALLQPVLDVAYRYGGLSQPMRAETLIGAAH